jgi:opacity protein-like surface antigen
MLMIYVTGGVAAVQTRTTWAVSFPFPGGDESFQFKEWNWGWVAGFGVEWAATDRLSLRSEVLYVGLGDRDYTFNSALFGFGPANVTPQRFDLGGADRRQCAPDQGLTDTHLESWDQSKAPGSARNLFALRPARP